MMGSEGLVLRRLLKQPLWGEVKGIENFALTVILSLTGTPHNIKEKMTATDSQENRFSPVYFVCVGEWGVITAGI